MISLDSKNVYKNPRLQHPYFTLKNVLLQLPHTFFESTDIIDYCYAFGFPGNWGSLP